MLSLFFTTFFATHCHVCVFGAEHVQAAVTQSHGAIHGLYKAVVEGLINAWNHMKNDLLQLAHTCL